MSEAVNINVDLSGYSEIDRKIMTKVTMELTTAAVKAGACQAIIDLGLDKELAFKICNAITFSTPKWNEKMIESLDVNKIVKELKEEESQNAQRTNSTI